MNSITPLFPGTDQLQLKPDITLLHQFEDTELPATFISALRSSIPEESDIFVVHNGTVQRQLPDRIFSRLHLKYRNPKPP